MNKVEEKAEGNSAEEMEELIVISDLHLSAGYNEKTGKYSRNEDFFFDKEFKRFLEHLQKKPPKKNLIIAGDMFDFLQVDPGGRINQFEEFVEELKKDPKEQKSGTDEYIKDISEIVKKCGVDIDKSKQNITDKEIFYGLGTGQLKTVWKLVEIVNGHKEFFVALANFLYEGNRLTIITGNHDIELYWPCVTEVLKVCTAVQFKDDSMKEQKLNTTRNSIKAKIDFCHWFYYNQEFKVYIEHGNQYDTFNSFEYFLYPHLGVDSDTLWLPFGSYLVRYFFNKLETVHPFADNIKPISKYALWAWREDKLVLLKVIKEHFFMVFKIFKRRKDFFKADTEKLKGLNEAKLEELKKSNEPHFDKIDEIYRSMKTPLTYSKLSIFFFFAGTISFVITVLALVVLVILYIFDINIPLSAILSPLGLSLVPIGKWIYHKYFEKNFFEKNKKKIQMIKENLNDVQTIIFGHTHDPDIRKVNNDCWYVNTGTWTTVFSEEERIIREAKQFAFVWIKKKNGELSPELCRWNDYRNQSEKLILFESKSGK
jgi:UDP-2,3-diacylglucosamine pyrophosphatase LpxH